MSSREIPGSGKSEDRNDDWKAERQKITGWGIEAGLGHVNERATSGGDSDEVGLRKNLAWRIRPAAD